MIEHKVFPFDTRTTVSSIMMQVIQAGFSNNVQEAGAFIDKASSEISKAMAHYALSRISHGRSYTIEAVYNEVSSIIYNHLARTVNNLTQDQLEKAKLMVYREITLGFSSQHPLDYGKWEDTRLVQTSPHEFTINVNRNTSTVPGANAGIYHSAYATGSF